MGPVAILDKSAFQAFSWREHVRFGQYFHENVVPILVHEIVADLSKKPSGEKSPEERVRVLAQKFGGSGAAANLDWRMASVASLAGAGVPMTGQVLVDQWKTFRDSDGSVAALIEPSAINHLILKLAYAPLGPAPPLDAQAFLGAALAR